MALKYGKFPKLSEYCSNSFRLHGIHDASAAYRVIRYEGLLEEDEDYEKKLRLLANVLSGRHLRLPVEPIRLGEERVLAVVGEREQLSHLSIPGYECLTPDRVLLRMDDHLHTLSFQDPKGLQLRLARRALLFSLDGIAGRSTRWWVYGRRYVSRFPDERASNDQVLVHPAFYFGIVPGQDGLLELVLDPSVCYVERFSLYEKYGDHIPKSVVGRRYLYKYGSEWYKIDALAVSNPADKERMVDPVTGRSITIWDRVVDRCGGKGVASIDSLSPSALTIAYKTRGQQSRRAYSGLLYELLGAEPSESGEIAPHEESIMPASVRGRRTEQVAELVRTDLTLFGRPLSPGRRMRRLLESEVTIFPAPKLRFHGDQELITRLETAGPDRFDALRGIGPAEGGPFKDQQFVVRPESMPEAVWKSFKERFLLEVQVLGGESVSPTILRYDDRSCKVREQARAIQRALGDRQGYALVVLPTQGNRDQQTKLHNFLKRRYWKQINTQCADVETIQGFYRHEGGHDSERWFVRKDRQRRYQSYLRYLALGYLLVNCKWLWKLGKGTLHSDVHVGIDVYKGMAVFVVIYRDADLITFHTSKSKRPEKLSADQVSQVLVENLGPDLAELNLKPSSITFHRDGKLYESELSGIRRGIRQLQFLSSVPNDVKLGFAEIHKTSTTRPRLYGRSRDDLVNPPMGLFSRLGRYEGALATTGFPMLKHGTARPLYLEVVGGDLALDDIAHDIYSLSHLAFASPGSCMRLPFTIALADFVLRESTPGEDDPLWDESGDGDDDRAPALQKNLGASERRS